MRALLLVILGLAIGAMGATFALSALHQGTPFHKGVMTVMSHHMSVLRDNVRSNRCEAKPVADRLLRLREAAGDIEEAFPDMDAPFDQAARHLTGALDHAQAAAPTTCEALADALRPVNDACQSCHRQYR